MTGKNLFIPRSQQKPAVISRQYEDCDPALYFSPVPFQFERPTTEGTHGRGVSAIFILPADPQQCGALPSAGNTQLAGVTDRV